MILFAPQLHRLVKCCKLPSVLREQYYMVKKLGGGGFGTVYMVQVRFLSSYLFGCLYKYTLLARGKQTRSCLPRSIRSTRGRRTWLTLETSWRSWRRWVGSRDQLRSSKVQMKECRTILDLEEYFESGLQSVILTEYLEVITTVKKESKNHSNCVFEGRGAVWADQQQGIPIDWGQMQDVCSTGTKSW